MPPCEMFLFCHDDDDNDDFLKIIHALSCKIEALKQITPTTNLIELNDVHMFIVHPR